jgi:hypothetical protein
MTVVTMTPLGEAGLRQRLPPNRQLLARRFRHQPFRELLQACAIRKMCYSPPLLATSSSRSLPACGLPTRPLTPLFDELTYLQMQGCGADGGDGFVASSTYVAAAKLAVVAGRDYAVVGVAAATASSSSKLWPQLYD